MYILYGTHPGCGAAEEVLMTVKINKQVIIFKNPLSASMSTAMVMGSSPVL